MSENGIRQKYRMVTGDCSEGYICISKVKRLRYGGIFYDCNITAEGYREGILIMIRQLIGQCLATGEVMKFDGLGLLL